MEDQVELRALTLWRPWPHAILFGGKRLENRTWKPWKSVIGHLIAIHAGMRYDTEAATVMRQMGLYDPPDDDWCPKGCIVGMARVTGFIEEPPSVMDPQCYWFSGPFAWTLDDVVPFITPVIATGKVGLWAVDGDLEEQVRAAYRQTVRVAS